MTKIKKKKNKFNLILISFLVLIGSLVICYLVIDNNLKFKLIGNQSVSVYANETYKDAGYEAKIYKINLNDFVLTSNNLDTTNPGSYEVIYKLDFLIWDKEIIRNIQVLEPQEEKDVVVTKPQEVKPETNETKPQNTSEYPPINGYEEVEMGPKYVDGILVVNKKFAIPKDFKSSDATIAAEALKELQASALIDGFNIELLSGYRSYSRQKTIYEGKVSSRGYDSADRYSARPGHSEHQTGLAFDVGSITYTYGETASGKWLNAHCAEYGFIIRYPEGKESITGYGYEPWHIRYVGKEAAIEIMSNGLTLEEYLGLI